MWVVLIRVCMDHSGPQYVLFIPAGWMLRSIGPALHNRKHAGHQRRASCRTTGVHYWMGCLDCARFDLFELPKTIAAYDARIQWPPVPLNHGPAGCGPKLYPCHCIRRSPLCRASKYVYICICVTTKRFRRRSNNHPICDFGARLVS